MTPGPGKPRWYGAASRREQPYGAAMERAEPVEPRRGAAVDARSAGGRKSGARLQGAFGGALVALSAGVGTLVGTRTMVAVSPLGVRGLLRLPAIPRATFGVPWSRAAMWPTRIQGMALARIVDVLLALLLAGASVAVLNLVVLLAEAGASRQHEVAVRAALGRGPRPLVGLLLHDLRPLFLEGCALGVLLGVLTGWALRAAWPGTLEPVGILSAAGELLVPLLALGGLGALAYATAGVKVAWNSALSSVLGAGGRATDPARAIALRRMLSALQMTVAGSVLCATLVLAATSVRSDRRLAAVPRDVSVVPVTAPGRVRGATWVALLSRLAEVPGVRTESLATPGALAGLGVRGRIRAQCDCMPPIPNGSAIDHAVGPGFFAMTGRKIVAGRGFTSADTVGAPPVAIVNRSFDDSYLKWTHSVGRMIQVGSISSPRWYTVVGIVEDGSAVAVGTGSQIPGVTGQVLQPPPAVYLSALQQPPVRADIVLRGPPAAVRVAVGALAAAGWSPEKPSTLGSWLARAAAPLWWTRGVSFALALLSLLLATYGVYVTSRQITRRRTRELAVRRAVGATDHQVLRHALMETSRTALWGSWGAMMGGAFLVGLVQTAVSVPAPPIWIYLAVAAVLATGALSASSRAAREAVRVEPAALLE